MYAKKVMGGEEKPPSYPMGQEPPLSLADAKVVKSSQEFFNTSQSGKYSDASTVVGASLQGAFLSVDSLDCLEEKSESSEGSLTDDEEEQLDGVLHRIVSKRCLLEAEAKKEPIPFQQKIRSKDKNFRDKAQSFIAMYEKVQNLAEGKQRDSDFSNGAAETVHGDDKEEEKPRSYLEDKLARLQEKHHADPHFKEQVEQEFHQLYTNLYPYCVVLDSPSFKGAAISKEEHLSSDSSSNKTLSPEAQEYFEKYLATDQQNFEQLYFSSRI